MSKREREDKRPDETPVTVIDLQATIQYYMPTFVTFANANSNRFQYFIIYSIGLFSCLVPANSEFLAVPPNFWIWGRQNFFSSPQTVDQVYATACGPKKPLFDGVQIPLRTGRGTLWGWWCRDSTAQGRMALWLAADVCSKITVECGQSCFVRVAAPGRQDAWVHYECKAGQPGQWSFSICEGWSQHFFHINMKNSVKINKLHCLTKWDSRFKHYFALFWLLGLLLGYLSTSGAKSDVIFLLVDPYFLQG